MNGRAFELNHCTNNAPVEKNWAYIINIGLRVGWKFPWEHAGLMQSFFKIGHRVFAATPLAFCFYLQG